MADDDLEKLLGAKSARPLTCQRCYSLKHYGKVRTNRAICDASLGSLAFFLQYLPTTARVYCMFSMWIQALYHAE